MNVDIRVETVIHAPLADVAAYASDPSHAPEWYANIASVEWETPPPVQVGSRKRQADSNTVGVTSPGRAVHRSSTCRRVISPSTTSR